MKRGSWIAGVGIASVLAAASNAFADTGPVDGAMGMQRPATAVMEEIENFHNFVLWIITAITILVLILLIYVVLRYKRSSNPTPRKFTHNMTVEVIWTIVPVLILVAIAARSFPLIFREEVIPPSAYTLKVTGNSWFWTYEYPDLGVTVTQNLLPQEQAGSRYLLATDNVLEVPTHVNVAAIITSNDVIHSWAVPAFGVKQDAIQGRTNEAWFNVTREDTYYGQCSELCGQNHGFMPIEIKAVPEAEFRRWVIAQGGHLPGQPTAGAPGAAQPAGAPAPAGSPTR